MALVSTGIVVACFVGLLSWCTIFPILLTGADIRWKYKVWKYNIISYLFIYLFIYHPLNNNSQDLNSKSIHFSCKTLHQFVLSTKWFSKDIDDQFSQNCFFYYSFSRTIYNDLPSDCNERTNRLWYIYVKILSRAT